MGKMKELFMEQQQKIDMEREYLIDDMLADESYEEFERFQRDINKPLITKIQVGNGKTRIKVNKEKYPLNQSTKI